MPAFRLLNAKGMNIGTIIINDPNLEREIINGRPILMLGYTSTLKNINSFTLEVIPPELEGSKIRPWERRNE